MSEKTAKYQRWLKVIITCFWVFSWPVRDVWMLHKIKIYVTFQLYIYFVKSIFLALMPTKSQNILLSRFWYVNNNVTSHTFLESSSFLGGFINWFKSGNFCSVGEEATRIANRCLKEMLRLRNNQEFYIFCSNIIIESHMIN